MSAVKTKEKIVIQNPLAKPLTITIGVADVKFIDFVVTQEGADLKELPDSKSYEFRFDMVSAILEDKKQQSVLMTTTILLKKGNISRTELGHIKCLVVFNVENLEEITIHNKGGKAVPEQLYLLTYGITLSTSRGMLAMKVENTKFSNATIPILDPRTLIEGIKTV